MVAASARAVGDLTGVDTLVYRHRPMVKDRLIVVRVDDATKRRLEDAAQKKGQTMTTFLVEAGEREAKRTEQRPVRGGVHRAVPTFFRATCWEAARGGDRGYDAAGWNLAAALDSETPYDAEPEEWDGEIAALKRMLDHGDDADALAWFDRHFPKCMALIPRRRRAQFLKGVQRAHEEGRV